MRDTQQYDPAARRGEVLDHPDHDHLGIAVDLHDVRQNANGLLYPALSVGHGRGRVLSRGRAVHDLLVSFLCAVPGHGLVQSGHCDGRRSGQSAVRLDHADICRSSGHGGLAMVVLAGGNPSGIAGYRGVLLPGRSTWQGALAQP
ncbi:hypothetical protein D9M71_550500 [compost metagenome]